MRPVAIRIASALLTVLLVAAGGCSDDPSGPGTIDLMVRGPVPLGAALVELVGEGLRGVEQPAVGWAELVPVAPAGSTPVHRLILIQDAPGDLRIRLEVVDVAAPYPVATVLDATDQADAPVPSPAGIEVLLRR
jgi:hypothetical protein